MVIQKTFALHKESENSKPNQNFFKPHSFLFQILSQIVNIFKCEILLNNWTDNLRSKWRHGTNLQSSLTMVELFVHMSFANPQPQGGRHVQMHNPVMRYRSELSLRLLQNKWLLEVSRSNPNM